MTIHEELIQIQNNLKSLEKQDKRTEALRLFEEYINKICDIGPYTIDDWPLSWTQTVWDYAASVPDSYSNLYIHKIDNLLNQKTECSEQLEFLKLELMWNRPGVHDYVQDYVRGLVKKYPFNVEFKHSYGHILLSDLKNLDAVEKGLDQYLNCLSLWEQRNNELIQHTVNQGISLAQSRSNNGQHDKALDILDKLLKDKNLLRGSAFNNILVMHRDSISNTMFLEQRLEGMEQKISLEFDEKLRNERKKSFELLGLFTAAISFILSTVSLAGVINYEFLLPVLLSLGLILIMFVLTVSLSLNPRTHLLTDFRFYILLVFLMVSILMPLIYRNSEFLITQILG